MVEAMISVIPGIEIFEGLVLSIVRGPLYRDVFRILFTPLLIITALGRP